MTETSLHTLDVTWEDILRQMLSCDRLRINCQNYKAFFRKFPKDSGRFCMIILIYFYSYHYHHCHCYYYYYYYYCYHCHIVLFTLSLSLSLSLSSSSWLVLLLLLLFFFISFYLSGFYFPLIISGQRQNFEFHGRSQCHRY